MIQPHLTIHYFSRGKAEPNRTALRNSRLFLTTKFQSERRKGNVANYGYAIDKRKRFVNTNPCDRKRSAHVGDASGIFSYRTSDWIRHAYGGVVIISNVKLQFDIVNRACFHGNLTNNSEVPLF